MVIYDLVTTAAKDETMAHTIRTIYLARDFGRYLGLPSKDIRSLMLGALYHDRGKLQIPDKILYKKGKLTDAEFEVVKGHVLNNGLVWKNKDIEAVILQHHEREDGSGYPYGLKGDAIHYLAKIFAIVDVYDALTGVRSYRKALENEFALQIMGDMRLNSELLDKFCTFIRERE